jgi:hypothetical protein
VDQVLGRLEQGRIRKFLPLSVSLHETLGRARDQIVPSSARLPRLECHDIRRDPHKSILPGLSRSPHPFDRHILAYRHMIVVAMRSAEECSQRLSVFGRHHARDSPECAEARPWRPQCAGEMKERHATLARSAAVMSSARCSSTSSEDHRHAAQCRRIRSARARRQYPAADPPCRGRAAARACDRPRHRILDMPS